MIAVIHNKDFSDEAEENADDPQNRNFQSQIVIRIAQNAQLGILMVEETGRLLGINERLRQILGYDHETLSTLTIDGLTVKDDLDTLRDSMNRLAKGESWEQPLLVRLRKANGHIEKGWLTIDLVHCSEEKLCFSMAFIEDARELQDQERRERDHAADLAFLSETSMDLLEFPRDGDLYQFVTDKLLTIVDRGTAIAFCDYKEKSGLSTVRSVGGINDHRKEIDRVWAQKIVGLSGVLDNEKLALLKKGRLFPIEGGLFKLAGGMMSQSMATQLEAIMNIDDVYHMGIIKGKHLFGYISILTPENSEPLNVPLIEAFVNQTAGAFERRRSEDRLREAEEHLLQAQKMEAIGQLAGGVAHDFSNILTGIMGYSEFLLDEITSQDPRYEYVQEVRRAADRASALTRQLLAFGRRQVINPRVIDLNHIVVGIEKMLQRIIGEDVELRTRICSRASRIKADPSQIEQVIMNLVVNARDAMPSGGQLLIETHQVTLNERDVEQHDEVSAGTHVALVVRDTGTGMDPETQKRIFEPFFTTKEEGKGTGLGLATVYGIVKQSGGKLTVRSEISQGTTFKILLPCVGSPVPKIKGSKVRDYSLRGTETILVVEDEPSVRKLVTQVLRCNGYTIIEASKGSDAIELFDEHNGEIDLLVTDVVMPVMGGVELAEQLESRYPGLRVLFTSGYTSNTMINHGFIEPGSHFLHKPFSTKELLLKIRQSLGSDE